MQDRIKELAIESGMAFNQRIDEFSTPLCDGVHVEQLTRFAQAIARECAKLADDSDYGPVQHNIGDQIRSRFGIAEAAQPTTCGQCGFMGSYGHGEPPPCNHPKRGNVGPWEFANPRVTPPTWCPIGIKG